MFWGVTLESGKRYSQVVESSFHLSMAALEPSTKEIKKPNAYVSVMIDHSNTEFLLCTLEHGKTLQVALDLLFIEGEEVSFFLNGEGTVHLTGYVVNDDEGDELNSELSEEVPSDMSVNGEEELEENSKDWSSKKAKKRKILQNMDSVNAQKKHKDEASPKKATSPLKSPKVDIVNEPSNVLLKSPFANKQKDQKMKQKVDIVDAPSKLSPSLKSPFANKQKGQNVQQNKKSPQNNSKMSKKSVEESDDDDDDEDDDSDELENDNSNDDGEDQSDDDDSSEDDEDDDEDDKSNFVPKLSKLESQSAKDSILVAKNKIAEKKKSPAGDTPNRSFSDKQNQDQKTILSKKDSFSKQMIQDSSPKTPKEKLQGGIEVEDLKVGSGPVAKPGKLVHVYYVGKLSNNKEFDSVTKGKPFSFKLGKGEVIKGWDVAVKGMKVGGRRKIMVPPHMGYGPKSHGPIPANSSLYFEVELKNVT